MKKVIAYQCEFCKHPRLFSSRSGCKNHEKKCWMNPKRKSCAMCLNLFEHSDPGIKKKWRCLATHQTNQPIIPFKNKIENCPYWEQSEYYFNGEPDDGPYCI